MGLLAGVAYDPGTAVSFSIASLSAMTVIDATNLTVSFPAPNNGNVIVKMSGVISGASPAGMVLVGIMQHSGGAVVARRVPIMGRMSSGSSTTHAAFSCTIPVTGLSGTVTWDAGAAVQTAVASTAIKYGGPNTTTTNDAWGAFSFEVWDAQNMLASTWYDPAIAVSKATTSLLAQTALDTTNLRATFTAPVSGNILVHMSGGALTGNAGTPSILLSGLESATVIARTTPTVGSGSNQGTLAATDLWGMDTSAIVKGVSAGSHNYDLAYGVDIVQTLSSLKYGGPNDALGGDAYGGIGISVWDAT